MSCTATGAGERTSIEEAGGGSSCGTSARRIGEGGSRREPWKGGRSGHQMGIFSREPRRETANTLPRPCGSYSFVEATHRKGLYRSDADHPIDQPAREPHERQRRLASSR
jgi:hypothetical protein